MLVKQKLPQKRQLLFIYTGLLKKKAQNPKIIKSWDLPTASRLKIISSENRVADHRYPPTSKTICSDKKNLHIQEDKSVLSYSLLTNKNNYCIVIVLKDLLTLLLSPLCVNYVIMN